MVTSTQIRFDVERAVTTYRDVLRQINETRDPALRRLFESILMRLRLAWTSANGADDLHETATGKSLKDANENAPEFNRNAGVVFDDS